MAGSCETCGPIENTDINKVTDVDGNTYKTVTIGSQVWMAENLKTTKFNDRTDIPNSNNSKDWSSLASPGYCWFNNDAASNKITYGALYNWYTIGTGKVCPSGWHVPSSTEWINLITYLGGENGAGGKLKEIGTVNWISPNSSTTNETGFTALPGGYRDLNGTYFNFKSVGYWWSSTESFTNYASILILYNNAGNISRSDYIKQSGLSVRCIKD